MIKDNDVKLIDFKFTDLLGTWQHFTTTLTEYDEEIFKDGLASTGRASAAGEPSRFRHARHPDPATAWIDIFNAEPTLSLICTLSIRSPASRTIAIRARRRKSRSVFEIDRIADTAFFGPEAEFFIFDDVRFSYQGNASMHFVDSIEGHWNSAKEEFPNLGYKIRPKRVISRSRRWIRCKTSQRDVLGNGESGHPIERQHHEVATAARPRLTFVSRRSSAWATACSITIHRAQCRQASQQDRDIMPKPLFADNGSGMHTHISLWNGDKPLFAGNGYAGLSDMALFLSAAF